MTESALLLLILCAMLAGYLLGRRDNRRDSGRQETLGRDYFTGLNYLLNEQTDEAIESFIKALDINADAFDTHMALGRLFCKRGEIEKSIRIYQDLLARPSLQTEQSIQVQLELARSYQSAGLLDRSEALLTELSRSEGIARTGALEQLLDIYQFEKEWDNALKAAESLRKLKGEGQYDSMIAHFYCELAEQAINANDYAKARRMLRQAAGKDKQGVRASMVMGQLEFNQRNYKAAINSLQRVLQQNPDFVPATINLLSRAYQETGDVRSFDAYLSRCLTAVSSPVVVRAMVMLMLRREGKEAAHNFLVRHLQQRPSLELLKLLSGLMPEHNKHTALKDCADFSLLQEIIERLAGQGASYHCHECGFKTHMLFWDCPSCKSWGSIKPD